MWAGIALRVFFGTLKILTNAHVARGRLTLLKYGFEYELTNEITNEVANEISAKQYKYRNLNPNLQKSYNLSEVDYDDCRQETPC